MTRLRDALAALLPGFSWLSLLVLVPLLWPTIDVHLGRRDLQDLWPLGITHVRGDLWRLSFLQTVQLQIGHHVENRYGMLLFLWPSVAALASLADLSASTRRRLAVSTLPVCALALVLVHFRVPYDWRTAYELARFLGLQAGIPEDRFQVWAWGTAAVCAAWAWRARRSPPVA